MTRKYFIIATAALLFIVPAGIAATNVNGVVGDTTDIDIGEADPNLAGLAGHAQYQVTWFDNSAIFSRDIPTADGKLICAVPDNQAAPSSLSATTTTYAFTDKNDNTVTWTTTKYTYGTGLEAYCVPVGDVETDTNIGSYNFAMIVDTNDLGTTALDLHVV